MTRLLILLLALVCTAPLLAEQRPSRARGMAADSVYQMGDLDNVNLFNGNLSLVIPIGQSYPVSPQLSYRLTLVYNSSVWDFEDDLHCVDIGGIQRNYNFPYLAPSSNAGAGWSLHFGRLFAPNDIDFNKNNPHWLYVAPDGSQHNFYDQLHPTEPEVAGIKYSLDGSYLRLDLSSSSPKLESPDGLVRTFAPDEGRYRLSQITDPNGNWMAVTYTPSNWTISDSHGRSHVITLDAGRVSAVDLDAFGGQNAHYTLGYTTANIERHRFDREPCDIVDGHTEFEEGHLLTSLGLPDGTGYAFGYYLNDSTFTSFSGAMRSASVPTGGRIEWDYATYGFQSQAPTIHTASVTEQRGVGVRRIYESASASTPEVTWTYDQIPSYQVTPPPGHYQVACWHRTRVSNSVSPTVTDSFFATAGGGDYWWYGLPFAPCDPITSATTFPLWSSSNGAPYLSTRVYERQGDGTLTPLRSTYLIYDSDGRDSGDRQDRNSRVRYQKVVYEDDPNGSGFHWEATTHSDFDGLGHFRSTSQSSSFGPTRTVETAFLPSGSYQLNPDTGVVVQDNFSMPSAASRWLNGLSSGSTTTQGSAVSKRETCFDPATGILLRQRQLAGASQAGRDVTVDFEIGTDADGHGGFVLAERIYGGDYLQSSPDGNLCDVNLAAETPAYVKLNSYQYGGLTRSAWVEPCDEGTEVLVEAEAEIDRSTGLAVSVVETNGLGVQLSYDAMGRLLAEVPEEGASRVHKYTPGGPDPEYEVRHCPQGTSQFCSTADRSSSHTWEYDGLGRLARQALAFPAAGGGDAEPSRKNEYDGLGRKIEKWTWGDAHKTAFSNFDAFGRARTIDPQGSYPTRLSFRGERIKAREVKIATGQGTVESVYATEVTDHLGRLVAVCEAAGAVWDGQGNSCDGQLTRYGYDQEDRLIEVCQNVASDGNCGQERSFGWDGRGFLMSETHPEIGAAGNGTIAFTRDARGNPLQRNITGDSGDRKLGYTYDPAGRAIKVEEEISTGWRPLKEFFYARGNRPGSSELRRGQLVMARRTNWVTLLNPLPLIEGSVPLMVTDHYEYHGLGGRVSKKTTSISLPSGGQSFTTGFAYDPLGNIASLDYPSGDWPHQSAPARQVTANRRLGFLTGIPGYADQIHYQLGGMLHEIVYPNGVTWRQTAESATGWERPDNIQTLAGATSLWSTGDYAYDGAGNISQIGDRTYVYDQLSRFAYVQKAGQAQKEQQATYDAYGNLTALAKSGVTRTLTTSPTTNRLTAGSAVYTSSGELADVLIDGAHFAYGYDGLGQQLFQQSTTKTWVYAYDASDERILAWECAGNNCGAGTSKERYTLRGLGGEVLRVFEGPSRAQLEWKEDYVYRDGQPLAWVKARPEVVEQKHFLHADHLGSTRQVVDMTGLEVSRHDFLPFGEESTTTTSGDVALKFTGQERDQPGKPVDYMHARFYSSHFGRFLSPDPLGGMQSIPQTWNLSSYVAGNPLKYVDPTGLSMVCTSTDDSEVCTVTESGDAIQELTDLKRRRPAMDTLTREGFARQVTMDTWSKIGWIPDGGDKIGRCVEQQLGLSSAAGSALVAAGQPWMGKRFITPGASAGTSLASSTLSKALPQQLPIRVWAPTSVRPFGGTKILGRVLGRWVPFVGWALLAKDAIGVARCLGEQ